MPKAGPGPRQRLHRTRARAAGHAQAGRRPKALQRAGANVPGLTSAAEAAIKRLPQVQGHDQVQGGPELGRVLQAR